MKKLQASELLQVRIDEMEKQVALYELDHKDAMAKKTVNGYKRYIPLLRNLEMLAYDNDLELAVNENDNLGVIIEALVKAYLGKGNAKSLQGQSDLVTGGKRFEIKVVIKGSSSYASSLDLNTKEDVLIISNLGAYILRNEDLKKAYNLNYFKPKENKLKPTILGKDILTTTAFSQRLTEEMGLNTWV